MRVLLTWELGLNLGHHTRLLPVARKLKSEGHAVLAAVRDIQGAAKVLGSEGIPFCARSLPPTGDTARPPRNRLRGHPLIARLERPIRIVGRDAGMAQYLSTLPTQYTATSLFANRQSSRADRECSD
jgi:hypothetical protein